MRLRPAVLPLLCAILLSSTAMAQGASLSPFHLGPSPFPSKGSSHVSEATEPAPAPSQGGRKEERVRPDALPPKEGIQGLDARLGHLALLAKRGEVALLEARGKEQGLVVRGGLIQAVAQLQPGGAPEVHRAVVQAGGAIEASYGSLLQIRVPIGYLEQLAGISGVHYVRAPYYARALETLSEGLGAMGLEPWYQAGLRGRGAKIAIADVGFDGYWNLLGTELPAQVTVRSFRADGDITGGGDPHGAAAAEIAYDVAPEASFFLVNFSTEVELGAAVEWLTSQGVHVISSSVGWPGTAYGDGTGTVNDAVKKAEAAGIVWVQAAGNFAQTHWTGLFNDQDGNGFHNFSATDEGNTLSLRRASPSDERIFRVEIFLTWDDWDTFSQDYDLFLFRGESVVAQSTAFQNGKFPPVEHIVYTTASAGDYWIGIQRFRATKRAKLDLVVTTDYNLEHKVAEESLAIPADSPFALTVGAVEPGTLLVRPYSSRGPTKDGRKKPDLVAADQVNSVTYGPKGFPGTSASAPYVAGAVALMKGARPKSTPPQIRLLLLQRAIAPAPTSQRASGGAGQVFMGEVLGSLFFPIVGKGAPPGGSP